MSEHHQRIEQYLEALVASDSELRAELRSHIAAMTEEAMLSGVAPEASLDSALRALGDPAVLSRAFAQTYRTPFVPASAGGQLTLVRRERHGHPLLWAALVAAGVQLQVLLFLYLQPG